MQHRPSATDPQIDSFWASLALEIRPLAQRGVICRYAKNEVLIVEGEPGEGLFVLLQGRVKVYSTDEENREITYGIIEAGDYFGEMSLDGGPRSASVMALEPCVCSMVTQNMVAAHLVQDPAFALALVAQVIRRARLATAAARNMALMDVYGRVSMLLESYAGAATQETPVVLHPLTHLDIAGRVGSSREMVSRLLKDLERGGFLQLGVKRITLLKKLPIHW